MSSARKTGNCCLCTRNKIWLDSILKHGQRFRFAFVLPNLILFNIAKTKQIYICVILFLRRLLELESEYWNICGISWTGCYRTHHKRIHKVHCFGNRRSMGPARAYRSCQFGWCICPSALNFQHSGWKCSKCGSWERFNQKHSNRQCKCYSCFIFVKFFLIRPSKSSSFY